MKTLLWQLAFVKRILRHPIDGYFDLRYKNAGGVLAATILYVLYYGVAALSMFLTNFIFNPFGINTTNPIDLALVRLTPVAVFIVANYLVSAIMNGQGRFVDIYIGMAYALTPYIVFMIPVSIVSHIFTLDEAPIYNIIVNLLYVWVFVMIYLHVKETHGYEIFQALKNIAIMLFAGVMVAAFAIALFAISVQSIDFAVELVREVLGLV